MKVVNFEFKEFHIPEAISLSLQGFYFVIGAFQGTR